jgi:hypothetical protein
MALLREANDLDPTNAEVLLHMAEIAGQVSDDPAEERKLLGRVQALVSSPKNETEQFQLAKATYLYGISGDTPHQEMVETARAIFERLGRVSWVRQCDLILHRGSAAPAAAAFPSPASFPQPSVFQPSGDWQIQVSDGKFLLSTMHPNGFFQTVQPGLFGLQAQGQWGFDPNTRSLVFQGMVNGFQPFALQIFVQVQYGNGFSGIGSDGLQYTFQRR